MAKRRRHKKTKASSVFWKWLFGKETVANLRRMPYRQYLKTNHWKKTRARRVKLSKYKCDLCGHKAKRLEVHHKTYERRGCERMGDLLTLCVPCHRKIHNVEYEGE